MDTIDSLKAKLAKAESIIEDYQSLINFLASQTKHLEEMLYEFNSLFAKPKD